MNEVDVIFIDVVRRLQAMPDRYRIMALFAANHWDDARLSKGIGGDADTDTCLPDNVKPQRPALALVKGD